MGWTLRDFFRTNRLEFSSTHSTLDLTRSYTRFSRAVDEIVDARVWSGIHFRIANEHAAEIGRRIARYRRQHYFRPSKSRAFKDDGQDARHDDKGEADGDDD
jgi:hypothetical protein